MMIDFHTHCFPDRILDKAMSALRENSGMVETPTDGSLHDLRRYMREAGIDRSVVLNIATNPRQQRNVNNFAIENNSRDLVMFGSVHPFAEDALEELERLKDAGIMGIKLHPDYQEFFVDDFAVFPVYETAARLGLITVFHAGLDCGLPGEIHCPPDRLKKALPVFGGGVVVAAHFGGYMMWDEVLTHLAGKNLYFDTSFCGARIPKDLAVKLVNAHGADKILLGSDLPWSPTRNEAGFIRSLGLRPDTVDRILGLNAQMLLKRKERPS